MKYTESVFLVITILYFTVFKIDTVICKNINEKYVIAVFPKVNKSKCFHTSKIPLNNTIKCQDTNCFSLKKIRREISVHNESDSSNEIYDINEVPSTFTTLDAIDGQSHNDAGKNTSKAYLNTTMIINNFMTSYPLDLWRSHGWFEDNYLTVINLHWLQFQPPSPVAHYALGVFYILMMCVGCLGNATVIFMYIKCRSLRTPANILVLNLAISDFCLIAKIPIFIYNSFYLGPALGKLACTLYGFIGGLTGTVSITTLSAIAYDRYCVVVRPLDQLKNLSQIRAKLMAVFAWIYGCIFSIIPTLDIGYGKYVPEGYLTSCSFDYLSKEYNPRLFIFIFFLAAWVVPLTIISLCYINILRVVVTQRGNKGDLHRLSARNLKEQSKKKAEIKLAGLVITVIILFFVSWTPYAIVTLLGIFGYEDLIAPHVSMAPALFCKSASCINPFIYIINHPNFRKELNNLIGKRIGALRKVHESVKEKQTKVEMTQQTSEDKVEVIEVKDIPYTDVEAPIVTLSEKIDTKSLMMHVSNNDFKAQAEQPPSWFVKPQFAKQKSFIRQLTK